MKKAFGFIFLAMIVIASCSKKKEEDYVQPYLGHDYAGMEIGKYVIYDVDSFFYDDFTGTIDTSIYQLKEIVDDKFIDL
ncbi:MAG: hypothetical protein ACPGSO_08545, partial [Vicingaceae bacterium]